MRSWMWVGALALGLLLASAAGAEQYLVNASAGNDGDAHTSNDDPDAFAEFSRVDVGQEFYQASADASVGGLFARASRTDPLPFAPISTSSAAGIEETIHFSELPPGAGDTVTITATFGVIASATATTGIARSGGSIRLQFSGGECSSGRSAHSVLGPDDFGSCNTPDGSAGGGTVQLVLTRDQLLASNAQVDIEAAVSAQLESLVGFVDAVASVSGGGTLSRGPGPVPGTVYVDVDPPLAHTYTGSQTFFPVPEPGAPLLAAVGTAALVAARRCRTG